MSLKEVSSVLGYQQITDLATSVGLTIPTTDKMGISGGPRAAVIIAETQNVRWRDDGIAPTASVGMPLSTGIAFVYDGNLNEIRFIEQTASAKLNISYYS